MGQRPFAVAAVFRLAQRPETVLIAADCSERAAPSLTVGQWLEFRNPAGGVTRALVSGIEHFDPPTRFNSRSIGTGSRRPAVAGRAARRSGAR